MEGFTFRMVLEIVVFIVIYYFVDTLIMKIAGRRMPGTVRKIIYFVGLVITYFVFTTLAGWFGYDIQITSVR